MVMQMGSSKGETNNKQFHRIESNWIESNRIVFFSAKSPSTIVKSEHPRLTNGEIILEEFQRMWSQSTNVTDRRTDRQTDDMRSQYRA